MLRNLDEEMRNDYMVSKAQKEIWNIELDLFKKLVEVCNRNNLKVFAVGGTLLGAIRHKGFIPWDDDMDLAMTRDDFTKLCEIAEKEFNDPYFFQYALSDRAYFIGYARLRNSNTTGIINHYSKRKYNNGIFIDLLIYDKIPNSKLLLNIHLTKIHFYMFLLENYFDFSSMSKKAILFKPFLKLTHFFISYEKLYKKYIKLCSKYDKNINFNYLGFLCNPKFLKYIVTVKGVEHLEEKIFEGEKIFVPSDYDFALTHAYGDYMKFPPIEERGKWHKGIIFFDPNTPYIEYYKKHKDRFFKALKEYESEID